MKPAYNHLTFNVPYGSQNSDSNQDLNAFCVSQSEYSTSRLVTLFFPSILHRLPGQLKILPSTDIRKADLSLEPQPASARPRIYPPLQFKP